MVQDPLWKPQLCKNMKIQDCNLDFRWENLPTPPLPTPPVDKTWLVVFCSVARNQQLFCVALISLQDRRWHKIAHWTEVRVTLKLVFCVSCVTIAHKLGTQFSSPFSHHRLGLLESQLSYGADRKISEHSNLGASITIGSLTGVRLKIR